MRKRQAARSFRVAVPGFLTGLFLAGCGGDSTGPPTPPPPPPMPSLQVSPTSVSLQREVGGTSSQANVTVMNGGGGTLSWTGAGNQPWIALAPTSGSLTAGQSQTVGVSVADLLIAAGDYAGVVTVTGNASNSPASVAAALTVTQPAALPVALGTPVGGITGTANSDLLLSFEVALGGALRAGAARGSLRETTSLRVRVDDQPGSPGRFHLFVRRGSPPTATEFDCFSATATPQQECVIPNPADGTWFARIVGVSDHSGASLQADVAVLTSLTVLGAGTGDGTVTSTPAGIDCTIAAGTTSGSCSQEFPQNTVVNLTATPASGSAFVVWSGDCPGAGVCSLTLDADKSATAQFDLIPMRTLTVAGTGTGSGSVTSSPPGIDCTVTTGVASGTCFASFEDGTPVSLSAVAQSGNSFLAWSGDCTGNRSCDLTMDADRNVTAEFVFPAIQRRLTVVGTGDGDGSVASSPSGINCTVTGGVASGSCEALFDDGVPVTLTAASSSGSFFHGWAGAAGLPPTCAGPNPTCVVTLKEDNTTFASFRLEFSEMFDIDLRFTPGSNPTQAQMDAFTAAEARWEGLMTNGIVDTPVNAPAGSCGPDSPEINETVDDLVILVTLGPIDGPGGTLGFAGPCQISSFDFLPRLGLMRFDTDDLLGLEIGGNLDVVILHEMGHVLGIGVLWNLFGLLGEPSLQGGQDPFFSGPLTLVAFDMVGGANHVGNKVPVENTGGPGTADAHWRESVFDDELMTGFVERAGFPNPLSKVSIASLIDVGYEADQNRADPYFLPPPSLVQGVRPELHLFNDIYRGPIYVTGAQGRILFQVNRAR
ncbi:MAG: leishmanolysin-related zinc metalloendopeptidase [Gemmatimonadota bacterium]